ncbi:MAG: LemA family protein [Oscillospiraceae bacterium]|nr:LemA family protein [Oscillospiraceae bacterium]
MPVWLIVLLVVVVLVVLWAISVYNKLVRRRNDCEEGFSTMDVYLKKRFDLVPNLVETVKGYAKHESETLEKVIAARNATADAASLEARAESENVLSGALRQLFALSEAYPDLKANTNFMDLQGQLKRIEEDIANARKFYNAVVKEYNNLCMMIPSSIIASLAHFSAKSMFAVDDAAERQNVKVEF